MYTGVLCWYDGKFVNLYYTNEVPIERPSIGQLEAEVPIIIDFGTEYTPEIKSSVIFLPY